MVYFRTFSILLLSLFFAGHVHGQKGEIFTGINLSSGFNPFQISNITDHWSAGAGVFAQYQFSERFGIVVNPNFRQFATQSVQPYCSINCLSHMQYNSLENNIALTFRTLKNAFPTSKIYLQLGYSFQHILRLRTTLRTSYISNDQIYIEKWLHENTGHAPFLAFEYRHTLGEKLGISWGLQYTHPIDFNDINFNKISPENPALLVNIRIGSHLK
jgi:hypothetical protein